MDHGVALGVHGDESDDVMEEDGVAKVAPGATTPVKPKKRKRVTAQAASTRTLRERPASKTQQPTPTTQYVTLMLNNVYFSLLNSKF